MGAFEGTRRCIDAAFVVADEDDDKGAPVVGKVAKRPGCAVVCLVPDFMDGVLVLELFGLWLLPLVLGRYGQVFYGTLKGLAAVFVVIVDGLLNIIASCWTYINAEVSLYHIKIVITNER